MSNDTDQTVNYYALLDCAAHDGAHAELVSRFPESAWYSLFEGTSESELVSAAPILLAVRPDSDDSRLRKWLIELERRVPSVSWIESRFGLATLGSMLSGRMPCLIDGDKEAILRFWDPRILLGLASALDVEQRRHFFFPVSAWTTWESRRQRYYTVSPPEDAAPAPRFAFAPLSFTDAQREQLMYYDKENLYDAILDHWAVQAPRLVQHLGVAVQREIAIAAVARCTSYGIVSPNSQILFAGLMMKVSPSFDHHPAARRILEDAGIAQEERVHYLIKALPEDAWREIETAKRYDALFEKEPRPRTSLA
ncbi:DUF4123 domain-containing protein [Massilia sp. KIM]|uniref:DUF4123 domain-containing protein n=1 Tax=Massilia sp. KIM TaxID=1955422 RepID=UPI0015C3FFF8|nr:DUF4123 domain-containing protein [Massilia sp. KIM]